MLCDPQGGVIESWKNPSGAGGSGEGLDLFGVCFGRGSLGACLCLFLILFTMHEVSDFVPTHAPATACCLTTGLKATETVTCGLTSPRPRAGCPTLLFIGQLLQLPVVT